MVYALSFRSNTQVDKAFDFCVSLVPWDAIYKGSFKFDSLALILPVYFSLYIALISLSLF